MYLQIAENTPLTAEGVVGLLLGGGLLSEQMLVEGDVRVEEIPGRNRNFRVVASGSGSYFVKQAPPEDLDDRWLRVEAELYRRALEQQSWSDLRPFFPRFRLYDDVQAVLVTDLELEVSHAVGFGGDNSVFGLGRIGESLAGALAACHGVDPRGEVYDLDFLPSEAPGILSVTRPRPAALQYLSPAQAHVIQVLQTSAAMMEAFDEMRAGWSARCLIHGDVKWSNVLVRVDAKGSPRGVLLMDWELAQLGDAAWDVGSVFHGYLTHAVLSAAVPPHSNARNAAQAIGTALPSLRNELVTFWDTYSRLTQTCGEERERFLKRSVRCCIARLVQSAYEWSQSERALPGRAAAVLQLGLNMLSHPDGARRVVLGGLAEH